MKRALVVKMDVKVFSNWVKNYFSTAYLLNTFYFENYIKKEK